MSWKDEEYYIFGAGTRGKICASLLFFFDAKVIAFLDNDERKCGTIQDDLEVLCAENPILEDAYVIVSSSKYENEIVEQLKGNNVYPERIIRYDDFMTLINSEVPGLYVAHAVERGYDRRGRGNLRVFFDHQIFEHQRLGGISRYYYELMSNLSIRDCDIDFFRGLNVSECETDNEGIRRYFSLKSSELDWSCRRILNKDLFAEFVKGQKYNIYHPTYYQDIFLCNSDRVVITIHDMIPELFWEKGSLANEKRRIIDASDGIIAVSENTKKDLINLYDIDEKKIKVIYHGNSLRNVACAPAPIYEFPYILYVGKREGYKNAKLLAKAFSRSPYRKDLKLLFFGGDDFTPQERQQFEELGISDKVVHSKGDDKALANAYSNAEVFIYPSQYEGFGIPVLEAMGCGCPVIASNSSSIPEVGGDAVRYFDPDSEGSLLEAMNDVLGDKELRTRLTDLGLKREKLFSWEKTAQETLDFYNELLGG